MSSRLHNKWHRHNHHTNPTADVNLPDSGHDPIASPESPFQGTFALNGQLSASRSGQFAGDTALVLQSNVLSLSANRNARVNGILTTDELRTTTIRSLAIPRTFSGPITNSGKYLEIIAENQSYYIPLWKG